MIIVFQIHFSALWVSLKVIDITRAGAIVRDSYIQTALDVISSPDLKLFAWLCPVLGNLRSESGLLVGTELSNSFSKVVAPGLIYIYIWSPISEGDSAQRGGAEPSRGICIKH